MTCFNLSQTSRGEMADLKSGVKAEMASSRLEQTNLRSEIERRPTHKQIVPDLFALAAFVSAMAATAARLAH